MEKTVDLVIEETKMNIAQVINASNLPMCIVTMILKDLYTDCKSLSSEQLIQHQMEYKKAQEEAQGKEQLDKTKKESESFL